MAYAFELEMDLINLDIEAVLTEAIQDNNEYVADLNAEQLAKGLRSDGSKILPEYTEMTIGLKSGEPGLAGVTDHVTLFNTGSHYRQLYAEIKGDAIEYGSKDEKSESLQDKYGSKIYGLSTDSKDELLSGHYLIIFHI